MKIFTNAILFIFLIGIFSCSEEQVIIPKPNVKVTPVIIKDVPISVEFVGQTFGYSDIAIRARVDGFLLGIHFEEGFPVKKGQLLYTIDPQPFEAKVAEAMGRVAEAKTRLAQAKNDLNRVRPLADKNAVSKADLDAAEANYGAAQAFVEATEASLRSTRINMGYTRLYSPINGLIGKTLAKVGDYVGVAPNPVVLNTVSRIDTIYVDFSIPESNYLNLMRAIIARDRSKKLTEEDRLPVELIMADGSVHEHSGFIDFVDRQVDPNTGTILIRASFPNPNGIVRPGQFAKIRAVSQVLTDALLVPQKSITEIQGKHSVFILSDSNKVEFRPVMVGNKVDDLWIIKEGLKPDEKVLYEGLMRIRGGVEVNPAIEEYVSLSREKE